MKTAGKYPETMLPNPTVVPDFTYKDLLLKKLYYPVTCSVLSQVIILQLYLFIVNFNILHPLEWISATFTTTTYFTTWLFVLCFLAVVFLQSIVCAKDYVITSSYNKNRFQKFLSVFSVHNFILLTLHLLIGGILVWLFLSLAGGPYEDFVYPCKQHNHCLNDGKFFLITGGVWAGIYYFVKIYVRGKHLTFPVVHQKKLIQFKTKLLPLLKNSVYQSSWPTLYFIVFYHLWGVQIKDSFASMLKIYSEKTDGIVWLYFLLWLLGTLYFASMNLMRFFFNLFLTEPVQFPLVNPGGNVLTLQAAILMENFPIVQNLACQDLYSLSCWSPNRRQIMFSLSQPGGHPHHWNNLITNTLKLFNDYTDLLNKSSKVIISTDKTVKPPVNPCNVNMLAYSVQSPEKYRNFRNMSMYQSPRASNLIISPKKPTDVLQEIGLVRKLTSIFYTVVSICKTIFGINYLFGELPQVDIQKCLANGNVIIWMSQGITKLSVASLKEDRYGIVQKDLPVLLTSLVQLRQSVEKLSKIPTLSRRIAGYDDYNYKMKNAVLSAVKRSLFHLCLHFGAYIDDFPLSKEVVQQLQPYIIKNSE